jgi:glutamine synthetase
LISAPSVASYHRLRPGQWAGAFRCWGRENREAAARLITSPANLELRCVDGAANPYLVVGAVCAAAGGQAPAELPAEVTVDPAVLPEGVRPPRLPESLAASVECLANDDLLRQALGDPLWRSILRVRRAEVAAWSGRPLSETVHTHRWRY